eukprot:TRINITY_DN6780_c0_g1_i2.p1 TRINITY_DN6780_c0_g1~~TRINITY_DN6780_c0_g1_i2.p1  ORF type:complete len:567 (+),score=85.87 TRINITY_DN6780_c0_g1_i2:69-1769(+)
MNLKIYTFLSVLATAGLVGKQYLQYEQFYPTMVSVATSKSCSVALGNLSLVLLILFGKLLKTIYLGTLRDREVEHLSEHILPTITDTLLAMTIFRDEFNVRFISMFTILLFLKIFHWLSKDRVNYIAEGPMGGRLRYIRIFTLMCTLLFVDWKFLDWMIQYTRNQGPSMMMLFAFEYMILLCSITITMVKFFLNLYDLQFQDGRWESKTVYVLYLEFIADMVQLVVYLIFFAVIWTYYGLPLHLIRQIYYSFKHFKERVLGVVRYWRAISDLESRFPNATAADLERAHHICVICRDHNMNEGKKLPCGHVLHVHCLRTWFQTRQECPICRTPLSNNAPADNDAAVQNNEPAANNNPAVPNIPPGPAPNFPLPPPNFRMVYGQPPNGFPPNGLPNYPPMPNSPYPPGFSPNPPPNQMPFRSQNSNSIPTDTDMSSFTRPNFSPSFGSDGSDPNSNVLSAALMQVRSLQDQMVSFQFQLNDLEMYLAQLQSERESTNFRYTEQPFSSTQSESSNLVENSDSILNEENISHQPNLDEETSRKEKPDEEEPNVDHQDEIRKRRLLRFSQQ